MQTHYETHSSADMHAPHTPVLSVTCHALNSTCVQTHTVAHLSSCFHLRGLLSNSTRPQTVYRTCNIVHLRGNLRHMTQSLPETHKQNGGGRMAARSVHVCRHLYPSGDERRLRGLKEAHSSCVLAARTISNMPGYQFSLRVKEIRTCF